ncbi:MAG: flagellin [Sulfurimonas sp.]|uniref:flagellin N-terminal helical domain-containing protein n=1 Tax=Sulfurimonas sp. TaxID=2022749 RepID=UPI002625DFD3|nr:flagellin [Sulfurimonas sp.]MDD5400111.1 flagellin [Sulfurimonas sp.]
MRISNSMYYDSVYGSNSQTLNKELFDVNKQISSGLKIQYAHEDVRTFTETMRHDNEIATLEQSKKSSENGYKISNQTDTILNDFETSLDRMKTLLIQSANGTQNNTSLDAVAKELRSVESHLKNLANSSINGQYLFSGSAINTKPITSDGKYVGNSGILESFTGAGTTQQYNISGSEFFLGEEGDQKREITANVVQHSLTAKYPQLKGKNLTDGTDEMISSNSTIRDLMGDIDDGVDGVNAKHHFYIRGTSSDGTSFNEQISMKDNESVGELLTKIGEAYGNTPNLKVADVSLNSYGQIVVEDKMKGSSKIEFHMVAATDFGYSGFPTIDKADINNASAYGVTELGNIENLISGENDFDKIIKGTSSAANSNLYVKNFVSSDFTPATEFENKLVSAQFSMSAAVAGGETLSVKIGDKYGSITTYTQAFVVDAATTYDNLKNQIESSGNFSVSVIGDTIRLDTTSKGMAKGVFIDTNLSNSNPLVAVSTNTSEKAILSDMKNTFYDNTQFSKDGSKLSSNVSQIIKETNAFATPSTKLSEVADLSKGTADSLDGTTFSFSGKNIDGIAFDAEIKLKNTANGGSTFSLDGGVTNYTIFNMKNPRTAVNADDMTYQQLMDVMNMVTTAHIPSSTNGDTDYDNAVQDSNLSGNTHLTYDGKIEFKDKNSTYTKAEIAIHDKNSGNFSTLSAPSVMTFNSNNAITVRDPKTDFFKTIDEIIKSVEEGKIYSDADNGNARTLGIQNGIKMIDDLNNHVAKIHSKTGAQSNSLDESIQRTELLKISAITLRSSVIDTDLAEASMKLSQVKLNYEAMLSATAKISQLSLVNYL